MGKFIDWIRPSFEGADKRSSGRSLTAFFLNGLCAYMVVLNKIPETARLYAFIALLVAGAVYFGLITVQNIIQFKHGYKNSNALPGNDFNVMRNEKSRETKEPDQSEN